MGLWSAIRGLYSLLEKRARWLLVAGMALATAWNLLQWRRDRERLAQVGGDKPEQQPLAEPPLVSILLPAWNEKENIEPCIESILNLRYPEKELIICAGGADGTLEIARSYQRAGVVVLEQQPGEGKQGALRRSFDHSSGEVIFLTDADCILDNVCFEGTLGPVLSGGEHAATGSWRPLNRQTVQPLVQYQWAHHAYREVWMPEYAPALDGRNAAVRRPVLEVTGAFGIEAPIGTDLALSKQLTTAGYAIRFVRGSRVQTEYPETYRVYRQQQSRWFRNPLVHEKRWLASPLARSHLRAGLAATFLISAPLTALFSGSVRSAWLGIFLHLVLAQLRMRAVLQEAVRPQVISLRACGYLPLGWAVTAESFWALLCCPQKRTQW